MRRKIEPDLRRPSIIVTVPGAGYKLAAAAREAKPPSRPSTQAPPTRLDAALRAPERRHITSLAAELAPASGGRLPSDPEDLSAMVGAFRRYASAVLTQHGGVIGESLAGSKFLLISATRRRRRTTPSAQCGPLSRSSARSHSTTSTTRPRTRRSFQHASASNAVSW